MIIPITTLRIAASERPPLTPVIKTRRLALERLYKRKVAVEDLIKSLEMYRDNKDRYRQEQSDTGRKC
ncbi:MAG TPA: hypothetical protein VME43_29170 [Bryobacteraceae bacterium]|nr:hypothetical protein [Bryobacteraceae bacterium]